jgi:type I restriction enzyme M protein
MTNYAARELIETLYAVSKKSRGHLDVFAFKSCLLSAIFLRHISLLAASSDSTPPRHSESTHELLVPPEARFEFLHAQRFTPGNGVRIDNALRQIEAANSAHFSGLSCAIHLESRLDRIFENDNFLRDLLDLLLRSTSASKELNLTTQLADSARLYDAAVTYLAELEGKLGEDFSTPNSVCKLFARLLKAKSTETICDPACGTASLLLALAECAESSFGASHQQFFGQEKNQTVHSLARMNLFVHGFYDHMIGLGDTLQCPTLVQQHTLMKFDIVASHPPFSAWWDADAATKSFPDRFSRGVPPSSKADFAFISHMLATLKESGRMAVVVPNGVLFRGGAEAEIRERLIDENLLDAVIALPPKLFFNTGIPAAILIFRKNRPSSNCQVLFVDATRDFIKGKNFNTLGSENIAKVAEAYEAYQDIEAFARVVSPHEIEENSYNLSVSRYIDSDNEESSPPLNLNDVRFEREQLEIEVRTLDDQIRAHLRRISQ